MEYDHSISSLENTALRARALLRAWLENESEPEYAFGLRDGLVQAAVAVLDEVVELEGWSRERLHSIRGAGKC